MTFNEEQWREIIDLETAGEAGLVNDLISDFKTNTPKLLALIHSSADAKDWPTLERSAHSLKSSLALTGLERAAELALKIESLAREKMYDKETFVQLQAETAKGTKELEHFRLSRNLQGPI